MATSGRLAATLVVLFLVLLRPLALRAAGESLSDSLTLEPRATYDLGLSSGSYSFGGSTLSYTEANVGLNLYFAPWLDWRNSLFGRFVSGGSNLYGLDSSVRGILDLGSRKLGLTAFAGPGWRFPIGVPSYPFAEAGILAKLGGIGVGVGAKTFLQSWTDSSQTNNSQIFFILAGGGAL